MPAAERSVHDCLESGNHRTMMVGSSMTYLTEKHSLNHWVKDGQVWIIAMKSWTLLWVGLKQTVRFFQPFAGEEADIFRTSKTRLVDEVLSHREATHVVRKSTFCWFSWYVVCCDAIATLLFILQKSRSSPADRRSREDCKKGSDPNWMLTSILTPATTVHQVQWANFC